MPGQIRPNKKAMKIAYDVLKTSEDQQQGKVKKPSKITLEEWSKETQRTRN
jgi:hypothetical protein